MAGIIIAILKIIGILLLVLVGLVLLTVCAVLFCPVRYHVNASKEAETIKVVGKGSYLFPIIRFQGRYESGQEVSYSLKILFFTLYPPRERAKKIEKTARPKRKKKERQQEKNTRELPKKETKKQEADKPQTRKVSEPQRQGETGKRIQKQNVQEATVGKNSQREREIKTTSILENITENWKNKKNQIQSKAKRIWNGIKKTCESVQSFREFITSDETKEVLKFLNQQRKYLFKKIKPSKCAVYLKYGFEDPALTGEVMGLYSILNPFLWSDIVVEPDFEESILEGTVTLKGSIRLYGFLWMAFRCYRQETIRKYIDRI